MDDFDKFIQTLEHNLERAEGEDWTVLCLNVKEGEKLLKILYKIKRTLLRLLEN